MPEKETARNVFASILDDGSISTLTFAPTTPKVTGVYYDKRNTTVRWGDNSTTTVRCSDDDVFDPMLGFLLCVAKRHFGGTGRYLEVMREHGIPEQPRPSKIEINCGKAENLSVDVYTAAWNELGKKR